MPKNPAIDLARPCSEGQAGEKAYGCLFCITGKEQNVVEQIQTVCPDVRATTMRQLKYRTCKKVKTREEALLLPSYIFFEAPSQMKPFIDFPKQNVFAFCLRIMVYGNCKERMNVLLNGFFSMMDCWASHKHIKRGIKFGLSLGR